MGQNQAKQPADNKPVYKKTDIKPVYKKTDFPNELSTELKLFTNTQNDCTGYKFNFETINKTLCNQEFYRYEIFISDTENVFNKNGIYIKIFAAYRGSAGTDYKPIQHVDDMLSKDNLISKWYGYITIDGLYNINFITYKFIDLVKDYHPVLYKLLVWLKNGK